VVGAPGFGWIRNPSHEGAVINLAVEELFINEQMWRLEAVHEQVWAKEQL
jgi:hypothetical protein